MGTTLRNGWCTFSLLRLLPILQRHKNVCNYIYSKRKSAPRGRRAAGTVRRLGTELGAVRIGRRFVNVSALPNREFYAVKRVYKRSKMSRAEAKAETLREATKCSLISCRGSAATKSTLQRHRTGVSTRPVSGRPAVLSWEEEKEIVRCLYNVDCVSKDMVNQVSSYED